MSCWPCSRFPSMPIPTWGWPCGGWGGWTRRRRPYRTALGFAPDDPGLLSNLGIVLQDQDHYAEAMDCFRRAIARQPDSATAHLNLSVACREEMQIEQSVSQCPRRRTA